MLQGALIGILDNIEQIFCETTKVIINKVKFSFELFVAGAHTSTKSILKVSITTNKDRASHNN
jgi:hypothetical protein